MTGSVPAFGPFHLIERAGRGGMGEVWRARAGRRTVAVKVVGGGSASPAEFFADVLEAEVRAIARLSHPRVVAVLDYGRVPQDAAGLGFCPGSPWIVMEWLPGALVAPHASALRRVLEGTLAGLAHAHARGMVHRDLKPGNLRLDARGRLRIVDFGLAAASGLPAELAGTPAYMAPEQLEGGVLGPWTDLYALGVVGWQLLTGSPPFPAARTVELARQAHRWTTLPDAAAVGIHPAAYVWLARLLQKDPTARFASAAEAASALRAVPTAAWTPTPPAARRAGAPSPPIGLPDPNLTLDEADRRAPAPTRAPTAEVAPDRVDPGPAPERAGLRPRFPRQAPRTSPAPAPTLGLWSLREPALVGREADLQALWSDARAALRGVGGATVLVGPAGVGRSRLGAEISALLGERGLAEVIRLGAGDGPRAVARALVQRGHRLPPVLVRWLAGRAAPPELVQEGLAGELRAVAARRGLVLVLDDPEGDTLTLARRVLAPGAVGVWVLTLARLGASALSAWAERVGASWRELSPLSASAAVLLAERLAPLDRSAAVVLAERAGGFPLLAVQLVGAWLARGVVAGAGRRFTVAADTIASVPGDTVTLLVAGLSRLSPVPRRILEIGAALGTAPDPLQWAEASGRLGLPDPGSVMDTLARAGMVTASAGRNVLTSGVLRDVCRAEMHNRAEVERVCAATVLAVAEPLDAASRAAEHLLHAGDTNAAFDVLEHGAMTAWRLTRYGRTTLTLASRALEVVDRDVDPARILTLRRLRVGAWVHLGDARADAELAALAEDLSAMPNHPDPTLAHRVELVAVGRLVWTGRAAEALPRVDTLRARCRQAGDAQTEALTVEFRGTVLNHLERHAEAREAFGEAEVIFSASELWLHAAQAASARAEAELALGRLAAAEGHARRAQQWAERARADGADSPRLAAISALEGEIARARGDFAAARRCYDEADRAFFELGSQDAMIARQVELARGLVDLASGERAQARARFRWLGEVWRAERREVWVWIAALHEARIDVWEGRWRRVGRALRAPPAYAPDPDVPVALQEIAAGADAAGQYPLARRARSLAAGWAAGGA